MRTTLYRILRPSLMLFAMLSIANAQTPPAPQLPSTQQLNDQFRVIQRDAGQETTDTLRPNVQIYQPVVPDNVARPPGSRLETLYGRRAGGDTVRQFGYDILGVPTPVSAAQLGAVQQNYVIGIGDEVIVSLRGQQDITYRERIDRNGQLVIPKLDPVPAAGRQFGEFREDLEARVAQAYIATNVFVSLGEIRQISVLVTGDVRAPGARILSAFATPLDAILLSGGIDKSGSLRNVSVIRGNQSRVIDLYGLLTQGDFSGLGTLQNGDRIYVPPLGLTVAVTGFVRHPGIYELRAGTTTVSSDELIRLAGGVEIGGIYDLSKNTVQPDGTVRLVRLPAGGAIANGETLFVNGIETPVVLERVTAMGALMRTGPQPLATAPSVSALIGGVRGVNMFAYTPFAMLVRRNPRLNMKELLPFSLSDVLAGKTDIPLQNDDLVYVFTADEARGLANAAAQGAIAAVAPTLRGNDPAQASNGGQLGVPLASNPGPGQQLASPFGAGLNQGIFPQPGFGQIGVGQLGFGQGGAQPGFGALPASPPAQNAVPKESSEVLVRGSSTLLEYVTSDNQGTATEVATSLGTTVDVLLRTASDYVVWVLNQVRDPGPYLAARGTTLGDLIEVAGGPRDQADLSFVEVTSTEIDLSAGTSRTSRTGYRGSVLDFRRISLRSLDVVRLRSVYSDRDQGQVTIGGQVRYAGSFDITRSERLSSLLERAGGLTPEAYPYGAIFTRRRAAVAEHEANLRQARETEAQLSTVIVGAARDDTASATRAAFLQSLATQLRNEPALGRISVLVDPAMLRVKPESDFLLEPGDAIYIPKRPSTVTVSGQVLNPGSFQYEIGMTVSDYVDRAGGTTMGADSGRMFVVMPDGSARPVTREWLSFNNNFAIPPGSAIIVPVDLEPLNLRQFVLDAAQITGQIAITAASLAILSRY